MDEGSGSIEWLQHTADAGFVVRAASPVEVYALAVRGLRTLLLGDSVVTAQQSLPLVLSGVDRGERLVTLLEEVLYRQGVGRLITASAELQPDGDGPGELRGTLRVEPYDPDRHVLQREVKAITYHQLLFERQGPRRWLARVIVDL